MSRFRPSLSLSAILSLIAAAATLGFFASIGLAVIGVIATVGAIATFAIGMRCVLGPRQAARQADAWSSGPFTAPTGR